jgi:hypothetical protein
MLTTNPHAIDIFVDTRVLCAAGRYAVLHERQIIQFKDHDALILHLVHENGHDAMFLRALALQMGSGAMYVVFDLRDVAPSMREIAEHHPHDVPGIVRYTLRGNFDTASEAITCMLAQPLDMVPQLGEVTA